MFEETKILNLLDRVLGGKHKRHKKQGQFAWMCPFCFSEFTPNDDIIHLMTRKPQGEA